MQLTSARFVETAKHDHTAICGLEVWQFGERVLGTSGRKLTVYPVAGSITVDTTAPIRRTISFDCAPYADDLTWLVPDDDGNGPIMKGTDLMAVRGFRYDTVNAETGLTTETVPWGAFRVERATVNEDDQGTPVLHVEGSDFSWLITSPLRVPLIINAGTEIGAAFRQIVAAKAPFLPTQVAETRFVVPSAMLLTVEHDPWEEARKLASTGGCEGFCAVDGTITMRATSLRASSAYVWDFVEGEGAHFTEPERNLDTDSPNVVTVIGNSASSTGAVRATVYDDDPTSPTYVGRYGEIHNVVRTELVRDADQATEMANSLFGESAAADEELHLMCSVVPMLDGGDTCRIRRPRIGVADRMSVITKMEQPLMPGELMDVTFRRIPAATVI